MNKKMISASDDVDATNSAAERLYFGYGSNLNRLDWASTCEKYGLDPEELEPLYPAYLPDTTLRFCFNSQRRHGGVLGIQDAVGCVESGYVFRASARVWEVLDLKEGHPNAYQRVAMTALTNKGEEVMVETYRVNPARESRFVAPSEEYLAICRAGRDHFGLDTWSLLAAAKDEIAQPLDALFAYGTIMRGESRFPIVAGHGLHCSLLAETAGTLVFGNEYPGFLPVENGRVQGDFFRSNDISSLLITLDEIEGFLGFGKKGNLFRRALCMAHVGDGRERLAWVYHICDTSLPRMPVPDWRYEKGRFEDFRNAVVKAHADAGVDFYLNLARSPFNFSGKPDEELVQYTPASVRSALDLEQLSELELAQVSDCWTVLCSVAI